MECYLEGCKNTEGKFLCNEHETYLIDNAKVVEVNRRNLAKLIEAVRVHLEPTEDNYASTSTLTLANEQALSELVD